MKLPKISVIIPVYNVSDYLAQCIESVINQTYRDIEIILVDDGSTDGSSEILAKYKSNYSNIKIITQTNKGLSAARNSGMKYASGDYFFFLDSDDYMRFNAIEELVDIALQKNSDIVIGECLKFKDGTHPHPSDLIISSKELSSRDALINYFYRKIPGYACGKLLKRRVVAGTLFREGKLFEDAFILPEWLLRAKSVVLLNEPIVYYRQRSGSIVRSQFSSKQFDLIEARIYWRNYFNQDKDIYKAATSAYTFALFDISRKIPRSSDYSQKLALIKNELDKNARNVLRDENSQIDLRLISLVYTLMPGIALKSLSKIYQR